MITVGLTGGIGSGKSTVAKVFEKLGIHVFYADEEAKEILRSNHQIKEKLISIFGNQLYKDGILDRKFLAAQIFKDKNALERVNNIVHPAVIARFLEWCSAQKAPYVLQEAAILFETGGYKRFDKNILITAPKELRIARIKQRDNASEEEIVQRMKNQWEESHKLPLADFVILNDESEMLLPQILGIHENLLQIANTSS